MAKVMIQMGLHSSKDNNYEEGEEHGLSEAALDEFKYALYEVIFDVELDTETGKTKIIAVDGLLLSDEEYKSV